MKKGKNSKFFGEITIKASPTIYEYELQNCVAVPFQLRSSSLL